MINKNGVCSNIKNCECKTVNLLDTPTKHSSWHREHKPTVRGFTLIEIVVLIGIVAAIVGVLGSSLSSVPLLKKSNLRASANALLTEEIDRLKAMPFFALMNRNNSLFAWVFYNRGEWKVTASSTSPSSPNLLQSGKFWPVNYHDIVGSLKLPIGEVQDFGFQMKIRIDASQGNYFSTGLFFRASDPDNFYYVKMNPTRLELEKKISGEKIYVNDASLRIDKKVWYTLNVRDQNGIIEVRLNDVPLFTESNELDFRGGLIGILTKHFTEISVDDIALTTGGKVYTWNFDNEQTGILPLAFQDAGVYDLPKGMDFLTIEDYAGSTNIKKVTARVDWQENNASSSASLQTLMTQ